MASPAIGSRVKYGIFPTTPSGEVLVFIGVRPRVRPARALHFSRYLQQHSSAAAYSNSTQQQQQQMHAPALSCIAPCSSTTAASAAACPSSCSPPASLPLLPRLRQPGLLWLASCLLPCPSCLAPAGSASSGSPPVRKTSYFTPRGPFHRGDELRIWTYSWRRLFFKRCAKTSKKVLKWIPFFAYPRVPV